MHEFAIVQRIIDMCVRTAIKNNAVKIAQIQLEIGDFSLIVDHLLHHSFEIASRGTMAENAELKIIRTPGILQCKKCGEKSEIWFDTMKKTDDQNQQIAIEKYESNLTAADVITGNSQIGRNLFQCRKCLDQNTELIGGRSILVKNIQIV
jgi:hydrogenase nickel incorporation protein HypA/HybF